MTEFTNAYHFIPVEKYEKSTKPNLVDELREGLPSVEELKKGKWGRLSHHKYDKDKFTGRIVCKLTTVTPLVIGGKQTQNGGDPTTVEPFRLDGKIAIPATSLRGMISNIVEAASLSALRVLEDVKPLSFRQEMRGSTGKINESLSALGIVREKGTDLYIEPVALPHLEVIGGQVTLPKEWKSVFKKWRFKIYINSYKTKQFTNKRGQIITVADDSIGIEEIDNLKYIKDHLGVLKNPSENLFFLCSDDSNYSFNQPEIEKLTCEQQGMYVKGNIVIGSLFPDKACFSKDNLDGKCVRGIVRILGRREGMPGGKYKEMFIPYDGQDREELRKIHGWVKEAFDLMAKERYEDSHNRLKRKSNNGYVDSNQLLPYHLQGFSRSKDGKRDGPLELKEGDIVFFGVDKKGEVNAVSYSSIWRGCARKEEDGEHHVAGMHDFFREIDKEVLPFSDKRETVTPAEALFGFAPQEERENTETRSSSNRSTKNDAELPVSYRGRLKFSFGEYVGENNDLLLRPQTLKILSSPKLPAPEMYFRNKENNGFNGPIYKKDLSLHKHRPQGRKMYVPKLNVETIKVGSHLNQYVTPIKKETSFWFYIDFENLTKSELYLLVFSLTPGSGRQQDEHYHKLGMGKVYGFGSVVIKPAVLYSIDFAKRYKLSAGQEVLSVMLGEDFTIDNIPENMQYMNCRYNIQKYKINELSVIYLNSLAVSYPNISWAIFLLGKIPKGNVHYPASTNSDEGYAWYVNNATGSRRQHLRPITTDMDALPTLDTE